MLKNSLIEQPTEEDPDEGLKDLVEITLKKMVRRCLFPMRLIGLLRSSKAHYWFLQDHDHDGRLSFADFEKSVKEENLLLEAFGTCLPDTVVNTD